MSFRAGGEGDLRLAGDLLESARFAVEPEGDLDTLRFLAGSSFVALIGCGWASMGDVSVEAIVAGLKPELSGCVDVGIHSPG